MSSLPGFDFRSEVLKVHNDYRKRFEQMTQDSYQGENILLHKYQAEKEVIKCRFELKYAQALGRLHQEENMWPWADRWPEASPTAP